MVAVPESTLPMRPTKEDIDNCRRCSLWERATQGVPGEGPRDARLMLVGEQPGDAEDRAGEPFVGAAGKLLRRALEEIGVAPTDVYITNAVKHFSWEPRGKRRMHKTPAQQEVAACLDWLLGEIRLVAPRLIVCLGGTAVRALLGPKVKVLVNRGKFFDSEWGPKILVTVHPSSILRVPPEDRAQAFDLLVKDLARINDL
jgi:DNA polymerase